MTESLQILVVDDNRSAAEALARVLGKRGDVVRAFYDGASAIRQIELEPPDLVLTDLKMSPIDGMEVLRVARSQRPPVECIVFTAFGDVEIAVKAMRLGARDFLTKPVTVEQVASRLDQLREAPIQGAPLQPIGGFIVESQASRTLYKRLERAAQVPSRVWLEGEVGTGRTFCAQTIHALAGSEGPFTIADPGRDAPWPESGTLFLPNVNDLPDDLQRQLARRLQHLSPKVRVISSTSADGRRLVTEGLLRPELYYALAVVVVQVPPLRSRTEDIRALFDNALDLFSERYSRARPQPDTTTTRSLDAHAWPGNVRELLNVAERMVVMGSEQAEMHVVQSGGAGLPALEPGFSLSTYLEATEKRILEEALRRAGGDRSEAGRLLGVERNTLRYKLNKYGLLNR